MNPLDVLPRGNRLLDVLGLRESRCALLRVLLRRRLLVLFGVARQIGLLHTLGVALLLLVVSGVLRVTLLDVLFFTLLELALLAGLCLALLQQALCPLALLLRVVLSGQHRACLECLLGAAAVVVLRWCLLKVFAHLRGMLLLREAILLDAFLTLLGRVGGLRARLHIQQQLRAGRGRGARRIGIGSAVRWARRGCDVAAWLVGR
ncbi:hypothetical protein ACOMHD_05455 [Xanthomonas codiaei]